MVAETKKTILVAEDEIVSRSILKEILKDRYQVLEAENGKQAVLYLQASADSIALMILDIHMPRLDGFGVMNYMRESGLDEKIPVIITTADQSPEILLEGRKNKVVDIFYKPFRAQDIRKTVDTFADIVNLERNLGDIIEETAEYLRRQYEVIRKTHFIKIGRQTEDIKAAVKEVLPDNEAHSERVARYCEIVAVCLMKEHPEYRLDRERIKSLCNAAYLYDVGKLAVPDEIFERGDISEARGFMQLRRRPIAAAEIIEQLLPGSSEREDKRICVNACLYMYERFNGKGYPDGMIGNEIPIEAQILGLAHYYDEQRNVRKDLENDHVHVMRRILESGDNSFNPDLLEVFEAASEDIRSVSE